MLGGGAEEGGGGGGHGVVTGSLSRSWWVAAALTLVIECRLTIAPVERLHIQFEIRVFEVVMIAFR